MSAKTKTTKKAAPTKSTSAKKGAKAPSAGGTSSAKVTAKKASTAKSSGAKSSRTVPQVGKKAPAFALTADNGAIVKLSDFSGKKVVLYFYPKDDTPGCTREACSFRDNLGALKKDGVVVLGVSRDSTAAHVRFRDKYKLNFPLLSDTDVAVHKAYGAWGDKMMYGKAVTGVIRSTFLIDEKGQIEHVWPNVKVDGHVDAVREAIG